jgi:hypothetical protein
MIPQFCNFSCLINRLSHRYCLVAQSVHCLGTHKPSPHLTQWAVCVSINHLSLFVIRGNT